MLSILYADHTVIIFISCVSPSETFIGTFLRICLVGTTQEVSPRSHFSLLSRAGQHIKPLGGFFIMETRAMFALPSALLSSQTISSIPAAHVYCKEIVLSVPPSSL